MTATITKEEVLLHRCTQTHSSIPESQGDLSQDRGQGQSLAHQTKEGLLERTHSSTSILLMLNPTATIYISLPTSILTLAV